jgi:tetratricopeptide (TPR) repeat protein/peroxiredoxin
MRAASRIFTYVFVVLAVTIVGAGLCFGQLCAGKAVPLFSLKDIQGQTYDISRLKNQPMVIIYFFDVESRPSLEGLLNIDNLTKQYKNADLMVLGITCSPKGKVSNFITRTQPTFPVLLDTAGVSDLYQAKLILPTICILGPELKLLDFFQGGGKTTEVMLVRLAERKLQRKQTMIAKAISEKVVEKNPKNVEAKTVKGYAALKEGDLNEAEQTFHNLSKEEGKGEILGKEGLSMVYAKKGQTEKALKVAKEVEQKADDRAYVHVVKGDLLYSMDKKEEAEAEYKKAIKKNEAETYQKAVAYNKLGRIYASQEKYEESRSLYDQAVEIDPYYIEATSNKGVTYEKEGNWDKALEEYRKAQAIEPNDSFVAVLAKKAQEMLILQQDVEKKKRIDTLVKELADRYRGQLKAERKIEDSWTSQPMVLSFVDLMESGGLTERDGFSMVLTTQLADQLNASGRVQVVERVIIDRLLEELNIGSSELADPATALKLGKVLAAKLIGTGSIYHLPSGSLLSLRLIDTETSAIPKVINRQLASGKSLKKDLHQLNRGILSTIILNYPLQAYAVDVTGQEVILNLGSRQGVVLGTTFNVIEEKKPIEYKGKKLYSKPGIVARVQVTKVEPDFCYANIKNQTKSIKKDDKLKESIDDLTVKTKGQFIQ